MMGTGVGLPVIDAYAMERARSPRVDERDDGMIADRAVKDVSECDNRAARRGECNPEAAALARIVMREARDPRERCHDRSPR